MERTWTKDLSQLNKMELVKLEKDGLEILADIECFAQNGFASISPEDIDLLKWAGVYTQKPLADGYLMMRVKLPSGMLTAAQAQTLAAIGSEYGRGEIQITTRQAIQYHWLRIENLPDVFKRLAAVNLTSVEACGDCPRNVIGNPLAGIDPDEIVDTRPLVAEVNRLLQGNPEFSNLPRKFKISISGSIYNPGHAEINDVAFTPAVKEIDGQLVKGFHVMVGGGLSAKPHMAQALDIFVRPEEVAKVAVAVCTIFRDYGYRQQRFHARLKFLVADWGAEKFREELLKLTGPLATRGEDLTKAWNAGYYYGVHAQKQSGLSYVGVHVPQGLMSAAELAELARIAAHYGDGDIRTTNSQNIIIANVPTNKVTELLAEQVFKRLTPFPGNIVGHAVTCTGNKYCKLAIVETKQRMADIINYLDKHINLAVPVRLHMAGCPNACGQQQLGDIGLQGALIKQDGKNVEAYELLIGGKLGPGAALGTRLKGRIAASEVAAALLVLLKFFQSQRKNGEDFNEFVNRVGVLAFQNKLDEFLGLTSDLQAGLKKAAGK